MTEILPTSILLICFCCSFDKLCLILQPHGLQNTYTMYVQYTMYIHTYIHIFIQLLKSTFKKSILPGMVSHFQFI